MSHDILSVISAFRLSFGLNHLRCSIRYAIEKLFAAKIKLTVHNCRRGAERVFKMIDRQHGVFAIMPQDNGAPVASSDIDAASRAHRRRKDKILNTIQSD